MAASKPDLSRAGTMQATAKDGESFLDRNLSEWRKPYLMDHFEGKEEGSGEEEEEEAEAVSDEKEESEEEKPAKKPKMSKHTTMKGTAKEADALLGGDRPDDDAATRGQQKKLENIKAEKPAAKKARMARDNTMAATSKEARGLLAGEKLSDTRQETKRKSKAGSSLKRATTIDKVVAEAEAVYGEVESSEGRSLRKRPKKSEKPALKKAGTMQKTAKEGKAYLKRSKKSKK